MIESTGQQNAARVALSVTRATVDNVKDDPKMQTVDLRLFYNEQREEAEHFHPYGFTSVPVGYKDGKRAEAIVLFPNGARSHPLVVAIADRRYRPTGLKEGEAALHDHQKQMIKIGNDGITYDTGDTKNPHTWTVGDCTVTWADGKATIKVGSMVFVVSNNRIDLGQENAPNAVMTTAGPSSVVFAKV